MHVLTALLFFSFFDLDPELDLFRFRFPDDLESVPLSLEFSNPGLAYFLLSLLLLERRLTGVCSRRRWLLSIDMKL